MRGWLGTLALTLVVGCGGSVPPRAPKRIPTGAMHAGVTAVAQLQGTPAEGTVPLREVFDASQSRSDAAGSSLADYRWDFGDGSAPAEGVTAEHVYSTPGDYVARLTVTDSMGRAGTSTVAIHAEVDHSVVVAFTPLAGPVLAPADLVLDASPSHSRNPAATVSCAWAFDDGSPPVTTGCKVRHAFPLPGTWHAQVSVTSSEGVSASETLEIPVGHDPLPRDFYFLSGTSQHFGTLADGTMARVSQPASDPDRINLDLYGAGFARSFYAANCATLAFSAGGSSVLWLLRNASGAPVLDRIHENGVIDLVGWTGTAQLLVARPNGTFLAVTDSGISANDAGGTALWSLPRPADVQVDQIASTPTGGAYLAGSAGSAWDLGAVKLTPGPFLLALGPDGKATWGFAFGAGPAIQWTGLGTSAAGTLVALGQVRGTMRWGEPQTLAQDEPFLLTAEADGRPRWLRTFAARDGSPSQLIVDPVGQAVALMTGTHAGGFELTKWNLAGDRLWTEDFTPADDTSRFDFVRIGLGAKHTIVVATTGLGAFDMGGTPYRGSASSILFSLSP